MKPMTKMWLNLRRSMLDLRKDCRGVAAIEFAMVVPLMLVLFFGTVEFSTAVAIDRKVTTMARTLSDLTSQNKSVTDTQLTNIFNASTGVMAPYSPTPVTSKITQLYIDTNLVVHVIWSVGAVPHKSTEILPVPPALKVAGTYLIYSEVSYLYKPVIGYVMAKDGIDMSDFTYTRPRQSTCVLYNATVCATS